MFMLMLMLLLRALMPLAWRHFSCCHDAAAMPRLMRHIRLLLFIVVICASAIFTLRFIILQERCRHCC